MSILISGLLLLQFEIRDIIGLTFVITALNSGAALIPYIKNKKLDLKLSAITAIPASITVFFGYQFSTFVPDTLITTLITLFLLITGINFLTKKSPPQNKINKHKVSHTTLFFLALCGSIIGFFIGVMGGGGAIIILIILIKIFKLELKQALAISLTIMGLSSLSGLCLYHQGGYIDIKTALIILTPSIITAYFSSKIAIKANSLLIKKLLGVYLIVISLILSIKLMA